MFRALISLLSILTFLGIPGPVNVSPTEEKPLAMLAHYRFEKDVHDTTGTNPDFQLVNAPLRDGGVYLNGVYENGGPNGYRAKCLTTGLDYSKFTVALRFRSEDFSGEKFNLLTGGLSYRWFGLRRSDKGNLTVELNNQSFSHEIPEAPLATGKWTIVACGIDLSTHSVVVYLNGKKVADFLLPDNFKLEIIDSDMKDRDRFWTFSNYSNGTVFQGLVSELQIYSRQLSPAEFSRVRFAGESDAATQPAGK